MQLLTDQKRGHTPSSYTDLRKPNENEWFIMQDVRLCEPVPRGSLDWKRKVAAALADIHTDNFKCTDQIPCLPHADKEYWDYITMQISVDHFEKQCEKDNVFAKKYAGMLPKLHRRAEAFVQDLTALYREGSSLTAMHGDLQSIDGDHVRCFQGKPMIIDWGFSQYAPFYIDLVDYFTPEEALFYLEELHHRGGFSAKMILRSVTVSLPVIRHLSTRIRRSCSITGETVRGSILCWQSSAGIDDQLSAHFKHHMALSQGLP